VPNIDAYTVLAVDFFAVCMFVVSSKSGIPFVFFMLKISESSSNLDSIIKLLLINDKTMKLLFHQMKYPKMSLFIFQPVSYSWINVDGPSSGNK